MWLILLILLVIIAVLYSKYYRNGESPFDWRGQNAPETPLEILKKRYAKGEIGKEEFDEKKKDLEQ